MQLLAKNMAHEEGAGKAEGPQGEKAEALGARRELGVACRHTSCCPAQDTSNSSKEGQGGRLQGGPANQIQSDGLAGK
jgi:hypothetical protein